MYIDTVPNRKSPPAVLLRESVRVGAKTVKRTLANLSALPPEAVAALQVVLRGGRVVEDGGPLAIERSLPCGHVQAVTMAMRRLGMAELVSSKPCPERDAVLAMIAQRLVRPGSKLESVALFADTTLADDFGVTGVDENDLYAAMDWLLERQPFIERKLAKRHLREGSMVFYDVSSSSYHGTHCPLAVPCYNRDGLKLPGIVYGLLTDADGRPVAVRVYPGNTADPATVPDQIEALRKTFAVGRFVIVGDRGMLTSAQIDRLREVSGCGWISCLRSGDIRKLIESRDPSDAPLFTHSDLAELEHPDFPGERLIACFNPLDGIYIVRTSEPADAVSASDAVRAYKRLGNVEKAFRTFKGIDLRIRPINHRLEDRVRAHILLCMLAYYVEWHMRTALAPLLYADDDLEANRATRDPVAKAEPSPAVRRKCSTKESTDGIPLRRWDGLIASLSTLVRNTCRVGEGKTTVRFPRQTEPNAYQSRVFDLLAQDAPWWPTDVPSRRNARNRT